MEKGNYYKSAAKCRIMADFLMLQCKNVHELFLNQLYIGKHTNNKENTI